MIVYVQVASAELDGQRWYTVAAGPNLGLADWLARALEVEGQRTAGPGHAHSSLLRKSSEKGDARSSVSVGLRRRSTHRDRNRRQTAPGGGMPPEAVGGAGYSGW
jgi:hypothetical protein